MKVSLILENGIRLTASLVEQKALKLLEDFINLLGTGNGLLQKESRLPETKVMKTQTQHNSSETKLLVYKCDECGGLGVIKVSRDTDIGDVITCRCGYEMQIKTIKQAFGDCANCGTKFYHMSLVNNLLELQCRNCKSPVDLVEKADGTLTGSHNLKY